MIERCDLIPVTKVSHPFARAELKCDFEGRGYVEEEYFIHGTANIYETGEGDGVTPIYEDAPYVNRVLIRRPKDPSTFSGNVVLEILNASARMDIDRMWVNSWEYFMDNGDIYIGMTSKADVLGSFFAFDPKRYAPLSWGNPLPDRAAPKETGPFGFDPQYENGLYWDMLTDYARLLRAENSPIKTFGDFKLYLTGWSQSTGYIVRYVKSFSCLPGNEGLFDGYLSAGGGATPAPINTYAPRGAFFNVDGASVMGAPVPFIAVNTESENTRVNWHGDSDTPGALFRIYEFPGSSHDTYNNLMAWYKDDPDTGRIGRTPVYHGVEGPENAYPYEVLFNAAFKNLYHWVRDGIPAPPWGPHPHERPAGKPDRRLWQCPGRRAHRGS